MYFHNPRCLCVYVCVDKGVRGSILNNNKASPELFQCNMRLLCVPAAPERSLQLTLACDPENSCCDSTDAEADRGSEAPEHNAPLGSLEFGFMSTWPTQLYLNSVLRRKKCFGAGIECHLIISYGRSSSESPPGLLLIQRAVIIF